MNIESQVCSLELAQKLLTLGVKQNSLFHWMDCRNGRIDFFPEPQGFIRPEYAVGYLPSHLVKSVDHWSAFTVAELGEILPNHVISSDPEPFNGFKISIKKFISVENNNKTNNWLINYYCDTAEVYDPHTLFFKKLSQNIYDPSLANAMAEMLIYLIENKLL